MKTILLTGATGFLGSEFIRLYQSQFYIIALGRHQPLIPSFKGEWVKADLTIPSDFETILPGLRGRNISAIVHIGGSSPNRAYKDGNFNATILGTQLLVDLAKKLSIPQFVFISSLSVLVDFNGPYKSSKLTAEHTITSSLSNYVILRPTTIIGPGAVDFRRVVNVCRRSPVIPLIGDGSTLVQPIASSDLCHIISSCLLDPKWNRQTIALAGPDVVTQKQFLSYIASYFHNRPVFLPIPPSIAVFISQISNYLNPRFGLNPERIWLQLQSPQVNAAALEKNFNLKLKPLLQTLKLFFDSQ